jgi:hypothetical protein
MAIFNVSDIIITVTLLVNALALVSSKFPRFNHTKIPNDDDEPKVHDVNLCGSSLAEQLLLLSPGKNTTTEHNDSDVEKSSRDEEGTSTGASVMIRLQTLVYEIRKFSVVIVIWNIFFIILMVFVFGS